MEARPLNRGAEAFVCATDGLVSVDKEGYFWVQVANTTNHKITVRGGESLGELSDPKSSLKKEAELTEGELREFYDKHALVSALLDEEELQIPMTATRRPDEVEKPPVAEEGEHDHLGWGPGAAEPAPDRIFPSSELRELIDVDPTLTPEERDRLYEVCEKNINAFGFDGRLGELKTRVHIDLKPGTKPISMAPYHASPLNRGIIDAQLDTWLQLGVIEAGKGPWAAPVIIVHRNGKPRLCIDYRRLNEATVADQHPIPKQSDILGSLSGSKYLSVFDALSGFTQMQFDEESRPITGIRTHRGLHQFTRMPFGWRNGPPEFQRAMQEILAPFLWLFALVYIDDIVVFSKTFDKHEKHVDLVLRAISKAGLTLSPPKCHLGYTSITVLGHLVSRLGLATTAEKIRAMWDIAPPKEPTSLLSFLGLAVYFASFIPYFAYMAKPLFALTRAKPQEYEWKAEHQLAFEQIKLALVSSPVRGHPEAGKPYRLYTDASGYAIAGALQQIQTIAVRDLKGTRAFDKLQNAHSKNEPVPDLLLKLSDKHDDRIEAPAWAMDWLDTLVPVERVISYWSRVLTGPETRYSATEREALACKEALVKFQPFIEGERILLVTDHAALQWAKTYENANRRLSAWGTVFAAYPDMTIIHRPGRVHSNVDPLSRLARLPEYITPTHGSLPDDSLSTEHEFKAKEWLKFLSSQEKSVSSFLSTRAQKKKAEVVEGPETKRSPLVPSLPKALERRKNQNPSMDLQPSPKLHVFIPEDLIQILVAAYAKDKEFSAIYLRTLEEKVEHTKFCIYRVSEKGLLYLIDKRERFRLCVPLAARKIILSEVHDAPQESAHAGEEKTLSCMKERFFWSKMGTDIKEYVQTCDVCQKTKHDRSKPPGFLNPLQIPDGPFEVISMDFITGLPPSQGFDAILVIVDKFTKYGFFIPTTSTVTAAQTTDLVFNNVTKIFGLPRDIVSDRDPRFTSHFWKSLASAFQTRLAMSTSKHPQVDGQTEVMNAGLETKLRAYVNEDRSDWAAWLGILQLAYNGTVHSSHQRSPAEMLFGFKPRTPLDILLEKDVRELLLQPEVDARLKAMDEHRQFAEIAMRRAADSQAYQYDKGRRAVMFAVGDEVLINPHSLELVDVQGTGKKLMQRRIGPFEVTEVLGPLSYRLRLPDSYPMYNVVNVHHLTKYKRSGDPSRPKLANPRDGIRSSEEWEVDRIVGEKVLPNGQVRYRVRWKDYDVENDTWQTPADLRNAPETLKAWKSSGRP